MGFNYGHRTPMTTLVGQGLYGAVLGGLPQFLGSAAADRGQGSTTISPRMFGWYRQM